MRFLLGIITIIALIASVPYLGDATAAVMFVPIAIIYMVVGDQMEEE